MRRTIVASKGDRTPRVLARHLPDERVRIGRDHFRRSNILVCGLVRNAEKTIEATLRNLDAAIAPTFGRCTFLVLENDSTDRTREKLLAWADRDPRLLVLGDGTYNAPTCALGLPPSIDHLPSVTRIAKMATLRNKLLQEIEKDRWREFDYVMVVDLDLVGVLFRDGLCETGFHFATRPDVDAICALGLQLDRIFGTLKYYDPYAHSDAKTACMTMREKDRLIFATRGLVDRGLEKVESCFNGCTMYRRESLRGKRYCTYALRGEPVCEHVCLHKNLRGVYLNNELVFVVDVDAQIDRQPGMPTTVAIQ
jgi:hypothetical protein